MEWGAVALGSQGIRHTRYYESLIRKSIFCHFAPAPFDVIIERQIKVVILRFIDKEFFMNQDNTTLKNAQKTGKTSKGFTNEERAAMKARARELKAEAEKVEGENAALAAIAAMQEPDRSMAKRIHAIIKDSTLSLLPKTWYGMPAYANRDGKVVCFFRDRQKFKERYATFGFQDVANLDEGAMWPTSYALKELTDDDEAKIAALVKKAVS
jgi:uncharacterized protein YdhG (YjbR/CyaY superfamily)